MEKLRSGREQQSRGDHQRTPPWTGTEGSKREARVNEGKAIFHIRHYPQSGETPCRGVLHFSAAPACSSLSH
jgi:hypothetical protein